MKVRDVSIAVLLGSVALIAAACSSSPSSTANQSGSSSSSTLPPRPTTPAASGTVAALTGTSMEVQNPSTGQVTVSWTPTTSFTEILISSASDVAAGDCVTVTGTPAFGAGISGPLSAMSVSVTPPPSSGSCTSAGGFGGAFISGRGGFRSGTGGGAARANGGTSPNGGTFPSGGAGPSVIRNFSFASGKVTAVSAGGFTVEGILRSGAFRRAAPSGSGSKSTTTTTTTPKATSIDVTTSSTTTYSEITNAAASNLAVGKCVTARGPADQTGAITATAIDIRSPGPNGCTAGFRGFGGGGAGGGASPAGGQPSNA